MSRHDDEVKKLKEQVDHLTRLVGVLSTAFDKMSQSQAIVSNTVYNLVQAQEELTKTQQQLVKALSDNTINLDEIKTGVAEVLKRLPPTSE